MRSGFVQGVSRIAPIPPAPVQFTQVMDPDIRWIQRRKSFSAALIDNGDVWMEMITRRNQTAHTYNEEAAGEIAEKVRESYLDAFNALEHDTGEFNRCPMNIPR